MKGRRWSVSLEERYAEGAFHSRGATREDAMLEERFTRGAFHLMSATLEGKGYSVCGTFRLRSDSPTCHGLVRRERLGQDVNLLQKVGNVQKCTHI